MSCELFKGVEQNICSGIGQDILTPQLDHARGFELTAGKDGPKVEVVSKNDKIVLYRPSHDDFITGTWVTNRGPMNSIMPSLFQNWLSTCAEIFTD